jgi:ribose/xylose/arabinose/galactoside ABC-type transport system permease subunit
VMVYVFCALCACAAGLVSIGFSGIADADKLGVLYELDAITAVVVGGTALTGGRFSLAGSLVGAILIKTMEITLIRQGMNPAYVPVPKALIIIAVCLLLSAEFRTQLGGLFGRKRVAA